MSRFLPPLASVKHDYGIPVPATGQENEFGGQPIALIQDKIPRRMHFAHGTTEARVPTPFSRAYHFYFGLNGGFLLPEAAEQAEAQADLESTSEASKARRELRRRAEGAFRGICALFALRQVLQLSLELRQAASFATNHKKSVLYGMFARHLRNDPHRDIWDSPNYYVLTDRDGSSQVLAGISPLTGFFPAAKALSGMPSVYWYDAATGWHDPGDPNRKEWKDFDERQQPTMRVLLSAWVGEVYRQLAVGARPMQADLLKFGMAQRDIAFLVAEFNNWRSDLNQQCQADAAAGFDSTSVNATVHSIPLPRAQSVSAREVREVPFFTLSCGSGAIPSDVPTVAGKLVVTTQDLLNPRKRLHDSEFGKPIYQNRLAAMSIEGENLGLALGLGGNAIPCGYIYLNKFFTPRLLQVTDKALSREWKTLVAAPVSGASVDQRPAFLFPIEMSALKYLPIETLNEAITLAEASQPGQPAHRLVTLKFGGAEVTQAYGDRAQPNYTVDQSIDPGRFDLRVFPNLRLDEVSEQVLPADSPDRFYFARLRLSPEWATDDKVPEDFLRPIGSNPSIQIDGLDDAGTFQDADGEDGASSGQARFIRFRETPLGFYLKSRGICQLELQRASNPRETHKQWEIAVDFGTSNTCVAYRNPDVGNPEVLKLPMLTTSLLRQPFTGRIRGSNEGMSAALDFFLYAPQEKVLHQLDFFPSQVATRSERAPQPGEETSLKNGMVIFKNFSQMILQDRSIGELLTKFLPPATNHIDRVRPRFRIVQNIKWSDDKWLDVFMNGLRRHVIISAAQQNARVTRLIFSHPKSFSTSKVDLFQTVLENTWQNLGRGPVQPELISESEGVRNYIARASHRDCVVFDIGGGTTDVLAFCGRTPFFQMSFKLAAGLLDRYVIAAHSFRERVILASKEMNADLDIEKRLKELEFHKAATLNDELLAPTLSMVRCQTVWHGILTDVDSVNGGLRRFAEALTQTIYERNGTSAEAKKAIRGFFLSLLVTFGGLAYLGGIMNRGMRMLRAREGQGMENPLEIAFVGNGGKYFELLENRRGDCAKFIEAMFAAGDGHGGQGISCKGVFESGESGSLGGKQSKAAIALGMLLHGSNEGSPVTLEVCNLLGESNFCVGERIFGENDSLEDFYSAVATTDSSGGNAKIEGTDGSVLDRFLSALGDAAPAGFLGDSVTVPGLTDDWIKDVFGAQQVKIAALTRARLQGSAKLWQAETAQKNRRKIALEPVFVAELAALLEVIQTTHAG